MTAVLSSFLTIAGLCFAFGIHSSEVADIVRFLGVKRFIETRYVSDVDETSSWTAPSPAWCSPSETRTRSP